MGLFAVDRWGEQFRGVDLGKMHPAGAAAGELGQGAILFGDSADQLAGLFHNGQIGGEVGIQHIIGTQCAQQCHHLAFHKGAGFHAEFLAQRGANRGRGADHQHPIGVGGRLTNLGAFVPLHDAVHRAGVDALAAVDTDGVAAGLFQRVAAVYPHQIGTGFLAHTASDAGIFMAQDAGVVLLNGDADG